MLIAGNWKMNGRLADADWPRAFAEAGGGAGREVLVCPPATLLAPLAAGLREADVRLGAQDCSAHLDGAHTGQVSAAMLADLGCSHVIVGHSERRAGQGETDAVVRAKAEAALVAGLVPIVCVGETRAARETGRAEAVVCAQVRAGTPREGGFIIAYEPVWAIGTGLTPGRDAITAMHAAVREAAGARALGVLYGGSVKPQNAAAILTLEEVDGALVGGASLNPADFAAIARSTAR